MTHSKQPPRVPELIVDEAGNSPAWLPFVGLGLLAFLGLLIAVQQAIHAPVQTRSMAARAVAHVAPAKETPAAEHVAPENTDGRTLVPTTPGAPELTPAQVLRRMFD